MKARYLGGPRDGDYTEVTGPEWYEPLRAPLRVRFTDQALAPESCFIKCRVYDLRRTYDGEYVYVARPIQ